MYNYNDTLVSYKDSRAIERRDMYRSRPSYFVSKQTPVQNLDARSTFYQTKSEGHQGVIAPQTHFTQTLTASPGGFGQTNYSRKVKYEPSRDSPIMKVTTKKQLYYPALSSEVEEELKVQEGYALVPTYQKTYYQEEPDYRRSQTAYPRGSYRERSYDCRDTRNRRRYGERSPDNRDSRSVTKTKQHDRYNKTTKVSDNVITLQTVPVMPTQTLVPMYTQVPMYNQPQTYTSFYPVNTNYVYTPGTYQQKYGSGKL